ncbi:MAG: YihA family ribosome biogenesis GTP-binding protein [Maricaulis sp.]|jgi:GTP-binding protein|nr:YihA family ribosome biogenesis GTP-binding protein [Maricaulis sp.]HAQ34486.1 YihA family ribosome biogenesis GTP-binding protein [Alphaproteobacteria bacterium]
MLGAVAMDGLPPPDMPEAAFAGRSNVGKSSLINALTNHRQLARASGEPGRTRELNFFDLGGVIRLVDLPGYGFAKAPKKAAERWTRLTADFLRGRPNLKRVFLLIDSRHGLKTSDEAVMKDFDIAAVSYQIVLTKIDKLKPDEIAPRIADTAKKIERRPAAFPQIIATSSAKGDGIDELRDAVAALAPEFSG